MLHDNAQLARVYLHGYQVTGNEFYKRVTTEILDYVVREMTYPNGGFYASWDADSEGHEGEILCMNAGSDTQRVGGSSLGLVVVSKSKNEAVDVELLMDVYGAAARGIFEGKTILNLARDVDGLGERHRLTLVSHF